LSCQLRDILWNVSNGTLEDFDDVVTDELATPGRARAASDARPGVAMSITREAESLSTS
jgi:hypothetical protein